MEIKDIRIEERLIHGQVVTVWLNELKVNRIIVIDNETSKNEMQKQMLRMACPSGIKLSIFSVDRAIEKLKENPYEGEKVFILIKNPNNLKELHDKGFLIEKVNVGNMGGKEGAIPIKKAVSVLPHEVKIFKELHEQGVHFIAKMVPNDPDVDFMKLIHQIDEQ